MTCAITDAHSHLLLFQCAPHRAKATNSSLAHTI
jgi:hypothetical protein